VPIHSGDDAAAIAARVLVQEHRIFPLAAQWFAQGRLQLRGNCATLDDEPLPSTGFVFRDSVDE